MKSASPSCFANHKLSISSYPHYLFITIKNPTLCLTLTLPHTMYIFQNPAQWFCKLLERAPETVQVMTNACISWTLHTGNSFQAIDSKGRGCLLISARKQQRPHRVTTITACSYPHDPVNGTHGAFQCEQRAPQVEH